MTRKIRGNLYVGPSCACNVDGVLSLLSHLQDVLYSATSFVSRGSLAFKVSIRSSGKTLRYILLRLPIPQVPATANNIAIVVILVLPSPLLPTSPLTTLIGPADVSVTDRCGCLPLPTFASLRSLFTPLAHSPSRRYTPFRNSSKAGSLKDSLIRKPRNMIPLLVPPSSTTFTFASLSLAERVLYD